MDTQLHLQQKITDYRGLARTAKRKKEVRKARHYAIKTHNANVSLDKVAKHKMATYYKNFIKVVNLLRTSDSPKEMFMAIAEWASNEKQINHLARRTAGVLDKFKKESISQREANVFVRAAKTLKI